MGFERMKPINFKESNCVYAKDQKEYLPLPVYKTKDGEVTSCWKFSFFERIKILFTGKVYLTLLTFNNPLQPQIIKTSFFEKGQKK
jgi:hypothetical protein